MSALSFYLHTTLSKERASFPNQTFQLRGLEQSRLPYQTKSLVRNECDPRGSRPTFYSALNLSPLIICFARDQHAEYFSGIRGLSCFSLSVTDNTERWAEWLNIRAEGLKKSLCPTAFLVWEFPLHLSWHKKSARNLPNDWEAFIFHDNSFFCIIK